MHIHLYSLAGMNVYTSLYIPDSYTHIFDWLMYDYNACAQLLPRGQTPAVGTKGLD